jgi:SAM-dependent methyltransferase
VTSDPRVNPWDFSHLPGLRAVIDPDDVVGVKNELINTIHHRALGRAVAETGVGRFATAVDFGCGVGRLVPTLLAAADRVVGVDPSAEMLDRARAGAPGLPVSFVAPEALPDLDPPTLVIATYVLGILPRDAVIDALNHLRERVDDEARMILIERVKRRADARPSDIEARDSRWYRDVLREAGWIPQGARRVRRDTSVALTLNSIVSPRLPGRLRVASIRAFGFLEMAQASRRGRRGSYVDLLMSARAEAAVR